MNEHTNPHPCAVCGYLVGTFDTGLCVDGMCVTCWTHQENAISYYRKLQEGDE
jgi:hypothetical protein